VGTKVISVAGVEGFSTGQNISIDSGENKENAVIASSLPDVPFCSRNSGPIDSITVIAPLIHEHNISAQISGSGITLASPLTKDHGNGNRSRVMFQRQVPNQYTKNRDENIIKVLLKYS